MGASFALAFAAGLPLAAQAEAPRVTWKAPVSGQVLSGTLSGSTCAVDATASVGMSRVVMWIGGMQIASDYSSPWNCTFDTRKVRDGDWTMRVDAYSSRGELTRSSIPVKVRNGTTSTTSANTPPTVAITSPASGATVSGSIGLAANATDNAGVARVEFFVDGTRVSSDSSAPYGGGFDTRTLANGAHTLRAVAYDAAGLNSSTQVSFSVQNSTSASTSTSTSTASTTTVTSTTALPAPGTGSLDAWFKAPLNGQTVSGQLALANCYVRGTGVARVSFFLDSTALNSDTNVADGMSCVLDTTRFANGTHQLKATAYDSSGRAYNEVISINIQNGTSSTAAPAPAPTQTAAPTPAPAPAPSSATSSLSSSGVKAVATFHSLGLTWAGPAATSAGGCKVQYKAAGESAWKPGLDLWYDSRNRECRGSLVNLKPNTSYEVQLGLPGQSFSRGVVAKTWNEQFPIAKTVTLPAGTTSQPLLITEGGSASGYVLYQANSAGTTIDVQNAHLHNVIVSAPYVIVRGLTLRGAQRDAIDLRKPARDVVIENNDISGWGRLNYTNSAGWKVGVDMDSAVRARCTDLSLERVVIQKNRIRDPRYGANSWSWGHPAGPQGITFSYCGGNHVMRYNEITSADPKRYFNDGIGGEDNFTATGFPHSDTDIYANLISGTWDDGIEAEGGNRNVRIWGNYIDRTAIGIASTVVHTGPLYVFRNVYNRSRTRSESPLDSDDRGPLFKAGSGPDYGNGRRYVFHNTALQPVVSGATSPGGAGGGLQGNTGQPLTNTVSRNNIFHVWKPQWNSINQTATGYGNDTNHDLYNGKLVAGSGAQSAGVAGTPVYAPGHGWSSWAGGNYQLAPASPGYDRGARLANFNDDFGGAGPDMGAHEGGKPAMKFGVNAGQ